MLRQILDLPRESTIYYEKVVKQSENKKQYLKFVLLNCRSLQHRYTELELLMTSFDKNTMICLTETWLNKDYNKLGPAEVGGAISKVQK